MSESIQTTWIWHDEASNGVKGAIVDLDEQVIQWMDQPGCACGDNAQSQTIQNFLDSGAIGYVPVDVLEEMNAELTRFLCRIPAPRK